VERGTIASLSRATPRSTSIATTFRAHRVQLFIQRLQTLFGRPPRFAKQQFSHLFDWIGRFSRHYLKPGAPYVSRICEGASFCLSVGVGLVRNPSHGSGKRLYSQMNARDVLASTSLERRLMPNRNRQ
jgi:hypothetical protein